MFVPIKSALLHLLCADCVFVSINSALLHLLCADCVFVQIKSALLHLLCADCVFFPIKSALLHLLCADCVFVPINSALLHLLCVWSLYCNWFQLVTCRYFCFRLSGSYLLSGYVGTELSITIDLPRTWRHHDVTPLQREHVTLREPMELEGAKVCVFCHYRPCLSGWTSAVHICAIVDRFPPRVRQEHRGFRAVNHPSSFSQSECHNTFRAKSPKGGLPRLPHKLKHSNNRAKGFLIPSQTLQTRSK